MPTYPDYIQAALDGTAPRYFSGSWDDNLGPPGFMTPHQISGAARVPLVKVYTLSGGSWYEIPEAHWVNERGEPNPYQDNGLFLLPMAEALPYVEAFRKYRAYRRDRFTGALPPEMLGRTEAELAPIREYIIHMKAKERAGWAPAWNAEAGRHDTPEESYARAVRELSKRPVPIVDPADDDDELEIYADIDTTFKRGWNRFYRAEGELPGEVEKLTVKWNGFVRIRFKKDHWPQFGERVRVDINGFDLTLKRHRSGKYYQVKIDAEERRRMLA